MTRLPCTTGTVSSRNRKQRSSGSRPRYGLRKALPVGPPQSRKRSNSSTPTRPHLVTGRGKTVPPPGLQGYGCGCSTQRKTPAKAEARSSIGSETNSTNAFTGQASPTENTCHGTACVRGHSGTLAQARISKLGPVAPASPWSSGVAARLGHVRRGTFLGCADGPLP